jgi:peptidoglycan LD-endopeptidase CwlK
MEQTSIARLNQLHPAIRDKAFEAYYEAVKATPQGVHPFVTQTIRTFQESDNLYSQPFDGKDNDGDGRIDELDEKVTNAKAGQSYHNYGLAIDFCLQINGKTSWVVDANWMTVVRIFKAHGFIWGADWDNDGKTRAQGDKDEGLVDAPHFQMTMGYHWKQLLKKYHAGDFIEGTKFVKI